MIPTLLQSIQNYYPIGNTSISLDYPGIKAIKKIITDKIEKIQQNEPTPHNSLVNSLNDLLPQFSVNDCGFFEFPSYLVTIDLEESISKEMNLRVTLTLAISLLVDYYTIYISNVYNIQKDSHFTAPGNILYEVVYLESCNKDQIKDVVKTVNDQVSKYFHTHKFISHSLLFNNHIKGGRTLFDLERDYENALYCYYDFLFSSNKVFNNYKVIP